MACFIRSKLDQKSRKFFSTLRKIFQNHDWKGFNIIYQDLSDVVILWYLICMENQKITKTHLKLKKVFSIFQMVGTKRIAGWRAFRAQNVPTTFMKKYKNKVLWLFQFFKFVLFVIPDVMKKLYTHVDSNKLGTAVRVIFKKKNNKHKMKKNNQKKKISQRILKFFWYLFLLEKRKMKLPKFQNSFNKNKCFSLNDKFNNVSIILVVHFNGS